MNAESAGFQTEPAGFIRRLAGVAIAAPLCALLAFAGGNLLVGVLGLSHAHDPASNAVHQTRLEDLFWVPFVLGLLGILFAVFWLYGVSLGASLLKLSTGAETARPTPLQALSRGLLTASFFVATLLLLVSGFAGSGEQFNAIDRAVVIAAAAVAGLAVWGYLWSLSNRRHQTLQDRLAGIEPPTLHRRVK